MSQNMRATPSSSGRHGSEANVGGSGIATMSDSSMALKPVIEEPSKPMPRSNASSSSAALMENDFRWPRMSVNQKRMKRMSRSATSALTSSAVLGSSMDAHDATSPLDRRVAGDGHSDHARARLRQWPLEQPAAGRDDRGEPAPHGRALRHARRG